MNNIIRFNQIVEKKENYVILSDERVDRNRGLILQDGWVLENFLKNPVMMYSHNWEKPPLGIWENVKIEDKRLIATPKFAEIENYDEVKIIKALWDANILKTVSVTFLPIEMDYITDENGNQIIVYKKQELLEVSIVAVPANPNAMKVVYNSFNFSEEKNRNYIPYEISVVPANTNISAEIRYNNIYTNDVKKQVVNSQERGDDEFGDVIKII